MKSIVARISGEDPLVPNPPGTRRTSSSGAVEKVCVGRMDWPIADGERGDLVVTGSRVEERIERLMSCVQERTLNASKGPKASRAWKPGKRTTPIRVGFGGTRLELVLFEAGYLLVYAKDKDESNTCHGVYFLRGQTITKKF